MIGTERYFDNNWVTMERMADQKTFVGTTDDQIKVKLDIETLEFQDWVKFDDHMMCLTGVAHSHTMSDGTVLSICHSLDMGNMARSYFLNLYKMTPDDPFRRQVIAKIPMKEMYYYHSIAATENYAIMVQGPVYFKNMVTSMLSGKMFDEIMYQDMDGTAIFHIVDLKTGKVQTIDSHIWALALHVGPVYENDKG